MPARFYIRTLLKMCLFVQPSYRRMLPVPPCLSRSAVGLPLRRLFILGSDGLMDHMETGRRGFPASFLVTCFVVLSAAGGKGPLVREQTKTPAPPQRVLSRAPGACLPYSATDEISTRVMPPTRPAPPATHVRYF